MIILIYKKIKKMLSINSIKMLSFKIIEKSYSLKGFSEKLIKTNFNKLSNIHYNKLNFNKIQNSNIYNPNKYNFSNKFNNQEDVLPDHLFYNIPKYSKNPENVDFPWLIGGAPFLELKVNCKKQINFKKLF